MNDATRACGAMTSAGTPCKRAPIIGGFRRTLHGGASPEAKRMANEALLGARLPAARFLFDLIESYSRQTCPVCQMPTGDPSPVIRAAIAVLDRTGHGPTAHVTLSHDEPSPDYTELSDDELIDHMQQKVDRIQMQLTLLRANRDQRLLPAAEDFTVPEDADAIQAVGVQIPLETPSPDAGIDDE